MFLALSIASYKESWVTAVLLLLCALLCIPLRAKLLKIHKAIVIVLTAALLVGGIYAYPTTTSNATGDLVKNPTLTDSNTTKKDTKTDSNTKDSREEDSDDTEDTWESYPFEVRFIDVGQGDATLILCDGEAMLIDAGEDGKGTTVQYYLQKQGVTELKYVIATHPDADHIGGMDVILYKFDCDTILMTDVAGDSSAYRDVVNTLKEKDYTKTLPEVGKEYSLGSAEFTILGPVKEYEDTNNSSIAIKVTYGNCSFIFTGDAEEEAESDMIAEGIDLHADVLKVGHHGSSTSTCDAFLKAVDPTYAVISCGADNSYGHPHRETMAKLKEANCLVYRTDEQGSIICGSDGENLYWNRDPSQTWNSGSEATSNAA